MVKSIIDPLNRIEGDLAVELSINDQNVIEDARCMGFVYRGFENIFKGKEPFDAMRMSQRVCGVCPIAHGTAGAKAIESCAGFEIPRNAQLVRDLAAAANMVVSHATHFYFMWGPDLIDDAYKDSPYYPELMRRFEPLKSQRIKRILKDARIPLHSVVAIFGGKFPHPSHAVPGGVTCFPKAVELNQVISLVRSVRTVVEEEVLNGIKVDDVLALKTADEVIALLGNKQFAESDLGLFIKAGLDLGFHTFGEGTHGNYLSYGFGNMKDGGWLFRPGYMENGKYHDLNIDHISEDTSHSYYDNIDKWKNPGSGITTPLPNKENAYSWIKSPRYFGHACEAGPLARQIVNNNPLMTDLVRRFGVNTYTRVIARLYECLVLLNQMLEWGEEINLNKPFFKPFPVLQNVSGFGLTEAPRGAVGHWIEVEKGLIKRYQIITPTTWNCSPVDSNGVHGAVEQALIGVKLKSKNSILEAGHIVRGFDPCISCSIHALNKKTIRIDAVR